jgi:hypothetical protein
MTNETTTNEAEKAQTIETEEVTGDAETTPKAMNPLLKAQEVAIDAVVEQTDRTADFIKNAYGITDDGKGAAIIDAAKNGVERIASFQKDLLERATDRIESTIQNRKEKVQTAEVPKMPVRELTENGLNMVLDSQEEMVNLGHEQGKLFVEGLEELSHYRGTGLVRGFARFSGKALQNVINSQERMLDINKDYLRANRELVNENAEGESTNRFSKFAFDRADDVIETSKQILDITKEQTTNSLDKLNVSTESTEDSETGEWFEVAADGVDRFAKQQKESVEFSREVVGKLFSK